MVFLLSIFILFAVCSAGLFFYQYTKNCMKIIILLLLQQLVVICTVGSLTAQVHDSSRLLLMMMSPCCIVGYLAGCFFLRKSLIDPHRKCGFRDARHLMRLLAALCVFAVMLAVLWAIALSTAKDSKTKTLKDKHHIAESSKKSSSVPIAQSSADERNRYKGDLKSFEQVQCGK